MTSPFPTESANTLVDLAFQEDLKDGVDATSDLLIPSQKTGAASIVARDSGVACGIETIPLIVDRFSAEVTINSLIDDGDDVSPGTVAVQLSGRTIDLLKVERTILNFMGRLSGISSLTRKYVDKTVGTQAKIFDTRKTNPGWRRLEKYAVKCGGGVNHRMGLYDAILIKDNHLAAIGYESRGSDNWLEHLEAALEKSRNTRPDLTIQIEVDTLEQLELVLPLNPDMILLDNMDAKTLATAVQLRGQRKVELEASGGVNLETVGPIAQSGVDRISVGALTHSATNFDWGLDWQVE